MNSSDIFGVIAIHTAKQRRRVTALILPLLLFFGAYLIKNPTPAGQAVLSGLRLFGTRLFPALFPMAVLAAFFSRLGKIPLIPLGFLSKVFRIGKKCAAALVFGLFAGFPVGALSVGNLYQNGEIEKEQAEGMLGIVSNPGIAFLIGGVGAGLFGDARIGVAIFLAQTIAVLFLAFLGRGKRKAAESVANSESSGASADSNESSGKLIPLFCQSVGSATVGMLNVCGYVVFFSVFTDFIRRLLSAIPAASWLVPYVSGFLEIGTGMQAAAGVGGTRGFLMAAAFAGWSGVSVLMQIASGAPGLRIGQAVRQRAILALMIPPLAYGILRLWGLTAG